MTTQDLRQKCNTLKEQVKVIKKVGFALLEGAINNFCEEIGNLEHNLTINNLCKDMGNLENHLRNTYETMEEQKRILKYKVASGGFWH